MDTVDRRVYNMLCRDIDWLVLELILFADDVVIYAYSNNETEMFYQTSVIS